MKYYMLYVKWEGQKRFRPVDWNGGRQVFNRIHATMFKEEEAPRLKKILHREWRRYNVEWELRQC